MKINWFNLYGASDLINLTLFRMLHYNRNIYYQDLINISIQGYRCKDCEEFYTECKCNENIIFNKEQIYPWIKYNFSKNFLINFIKFLKYKAIVADREEIEDMTENIKKLYEN